MAGQPAQYQSVGGMVIQTGCCCVCFNHRLFQPEESYTPTKLWWTPLLRDLLLQSTLFVMDDLGVKSPTFETKGYEIQGIKASEPKVHN